MKFGARQEPKSVTLWKNNSKRKSTLIIWAKLYVKLVKRKTLPRNSSVNVSVYNVRKFHAWKKGLAR